MSSALRGNFLDGGSVAAPTVKAAAGSVPMTQAQRDANARAVIAQKGRELAVRNAPYQAARFLQAKQEAAERARLMADPGPDGQRYRAQEKKLRSAGIDWGLIPAGAAVLATGAAIIATGGAVAGAIAAPSAAGVLGAAVAADRALAAAEKAKLAPKGAAGKVTAAIDAGQRAQAVIDTTVKLAEQGVPGAVEGARIIADTAAKRALSGALPGVPMAVTEQGAKAFDAYVKQSPPALKDAVGGGAYVMAAPLSNRPPMIVQSSQPAGAVALSTLKLPTVRPRWLVTDAGKVVDIDKSSAAASLRGFVVWSTGKVVKQ
jgi:hypothetical protein